MILALFVVSIVRPETTASVLKTVVSFVVRDEAALPVTALSKTICLFDATEIVVLLFNVTVSTKWIPSPVEVIALVVPEEIPTGLL